jgi:nuclear transport factor 2 (NTF2) superfamily protein
MAVDASPSQRYIGTLGKTAFEIYSRSHGDEKWEFNEQILMTPLRKDQRFADQGVEEQILLAAWPTARRPRGLE